MKKKALLLLAGCYIVFTLPAVCTGLCKMSWLVGYDTCVATWCDEDAGDADPPQPPEMPYGHIRRAVMPVVEDANKYDINFRDQGQALKTFLAILNKGVTASSAQVVVSPSRPDEVAIVTKMAGSGAEPVIVRVIVPWAIEDDPQTVVMR